MLISRITFNRPLSITLNQVWWASHSYQIRHGRKKSENRRRKCSFYLFIIRFDELWITFQKCIFILITWLLPNLVTVQPNFLSLGEGRAEFTDSFFYLRIFILKSPTKTQLQLVSQNVRKKNKTKNRPKRDFLQSDEGKHPLDKCIWQVRKNFIAAESRRDKLEEEKSLATYFPSPTR